MHKSTVFFFLMMLICITLIGINSTGEKEPTYYTSKQSAIENLLKENDEILTSIKINNFQEVLVIYDNKNEAIFLSTISLDQSEDAFFIEDQTNRWKIGGKTPSLANSEYSVGEKDINLFFWKGDEKYEKIMEENEMIKDHENNIDKFKDDVFVLIESVK
ncbi:hypothetical protein [Natranaerobius trueperi]|uniref:Uncharacterized protein n=1 Tax=Natranaerobius trueperi TaxID=759412 RepID=A0A226BYS3_9FIRM|nr:hypothetical protein [Natranaerobius trueperi]OWZ83349.1 hypothetical protein CDO51_09015 [Natranaerobius trueperi]